MRWEVCASDNVNSAFDTLEKHILDIKLKYVKTKTRSVVKQQKVIKLSDETKKNHANEEPCVRLQ